MSHPLIGTEVSQIAIDHAVTLYFISDDNAYYTLRVEGDLRYVDLSGNAQVVPAGSAAPAHTLALHLLHDRVCAVDSPETGSLTIVFTSGRQVQVVAAEEWEAWSLSGPDGLLVVSLPGGGLARWSAESAARDLPPGYSISDTPPPMTTP